MLESNQIEIPEMVFYGWGEPETINIFYHEDPETKNKVSSGFSVSYQIEKKKFMTPDFMNKLEEMDLEKAIVVDHNEGIGDLEITYTNLKSTGVETDDFSITFGFSSESSLTYLKPLF